MRFIQAFAIVVGLSMAGAESDHYIINVFGLLLFASVTLSARRLP